MTEYTGEEAVEQLAAKLQGMEDVTRENIDLVLAFKRFLQESGTDTDTIIVALYGWYELLPCCDFALDDPGDGDISRMVDDAPATNRSMYRQALTLFYNEYLPAQGVSVEVGDIV